MNWNKKPGFNRNDWEGSMLFLKTKVSLMICLKFP